MATPLVLLFRQLKVELASLLGDIPVQRRYMPHNDPALLDTIKVSLYMETSETEQAGRELNVKRFTFGVAVQKRVADQVAIDANGEPVLDGIDNLADGDAVMDVVETIKGFWDVNGPLNEKEIAKCNFIEYLHDPIYEPFGLANYGIFTSIVDVTYQYTGE